MRHKIYTIGHSNRTLGQLLEALTRYEIECLVDVRKFPFSRRNPQFNAGFMSDQLADVNIVYMHRGEVFGGHREPSTNDETNHPCLHGLYRAYATHMGSTQFSDAIEQLIAQASCARTCIMCAENEPSKCHRNLMADYLSLQNIEVIHILDSETSRVHKTHEAARLQEGIISYDLGAQLSLSI